MMKTFKEVSKVKTAAGDYLYYDNTYYTKLLTIDLENGVLTFFSSESRVKPYKDCTVVLYE